ncbi:hypothetical protein GPECTOR_7g1005 [Gonium pectorale]|uniref:Retinoblastoma-associated protein B-box domain-containing protein n=1 Tax=Gonium pectorale TaxID=33097 RepID=A0A150GTD1_GONPE|nr:hypothetical protein GPECTOR_7g1005 [Gonium pectorale]|eukprot:KXZ53115.1 hypothetical protein GPECTOR_7g1005 [Gonium pectorale]
MEQQQADEQQVNARVDPVAASEVLQRATLPGPEDWLSSEDWLERAVQSATVIMEHMCQFMGRVFPDVGGPVEGMGRHALVLRTKHLYYGVLYYILSNRYPMSVSAAPPQRATRSSSGAGAAARFTRPTVPPGTESEVAFLLSIPAFHTSLLSVSATLVTAIGNKDPSFLSASPDACLRIVSAAGMIENLLAVWNACRWFQEFYVTPKSPAPAAAEGDLQQAAACGGGGVQQRTTAQPPSPLPPLPPLPGCSLLDRLQRLCEERGVLAQGSTFYAIVAKGATAGFNRSDQLLIEDFLRAYTRRATNLAFWIGERLVDQQLQQAAAAGVAGLPSAAPHASSRGRLSLASRPSLAPGTAAAAASGALANLGAAAAFPLLAARLVDRVLMECLDLAYGQHISVIVACCLYGMARALRLQMPFSTITRMFVSSLPDHSADLFGNQVEVRHATVGGEGAASGAAAEVASGNSGPTVAAVLGDIRRFYNETFLTRVEGFIRSFVKSHQQNTVAREAGVAGAATADADAAGKAQPADDGKAAAAVAGGHAGGDNGGIAGAPSPTITIRPPPLRTDGCNLGNASPTRSAAGEAPDVSLQGWETANDKKGGRTASVASGRAKEPQQRLGGGVIAAASAAQRLYQGPQTRRLSVLADDDSEMDADPPAGGTQGGGASGRGSLASAFGRRAASRPPAVLAPLSAPNANAPAADAVAASGVKKKPHATVGGGRGRDRPIGQKALAGEGAEAPPVNVGLEDAVKQLMIDKENGDAGGQLASVSIMGVATLGDAGTGSTGAHTSQPAGRRRALR